MSNSDAKRRTASCECGEVEFGISGEPIMLTICHCGDCQRASEWISALPNGRPACGPDGGTPVVMFRRDRIKLPSSQTKEIRLKENSPTKRVVAVCCDTPLFLDFEKGHWISIYRTALREDDLMPSEMRVQTKSTPKGIELPDSPPAYKGYPPRFVWRLLKAAAAMRLGRWKSRSFVPIKSSRLPSPQPPRGNPVLPVSLSPGRSPGRAGRAPRRVRRSLRGSSPARRRRLRGLRARLYRSASR